MPQPTRIRIGTRKSALALAQTGLVYAKLEAAFPGLAIEIVPLLTSGDRHGERKLADIGGKALFTKELEGALLSEHIDIAVHSLKDMESTLPEGLSIAGVLEREDPRDGLVARDARSIESLAKGARVGTSSPRRAAQLKILRPDLQIVPLRGNVPTRISKIKNGEADATLLALAGVKRLEMEHEIVQILDIEHFLPAAGQGTIAMQSLQGSKIEEMMHSLIHLPTQSAANAERSVLATLGGSCRTPVAAYARMEGAQLRLDAMIATEDGSFHVKATRSGNPADALTMGKDAAKELLAGGGGKCLA